MVDQWQMVEMALLFYLIMYKMDIAEMVTKCATCLKIKKNQGYDVSEIVPTQETCNFCNPPVPPPQLDASGNPVVFIFPIIS
jgi:hypothetical protein